MGTTRGGRAGAPPSTGANQGAFVQHLNTPLPRMVHRRCAHSGNGPLGWWAASAVG